MQLLGPRGWQQGELAWGGPGQLPALSEQGSLAQGKSTGRRGSLACPSPWGLGSQCSSEHISGRVGHSWAGPGSWTLPTTSRASLISKAAWATCGGPHWGDRQVGPPNASSRSATQVPPTPSSTAKARGCQESGTGGGGRAPAQARPPFLEAADPWPRAWQSPSLATPTPCPRFQLSAVIRPRTALGKMATMARVGPGQSQEPRTPSASPTWVAGPQALAPPSAAFPGGSAGSWVGVEQPGLHLTLTWVLVSGRGLTPCTAPAPPKYSFQPNLGLAKPARLERRSLLHHGAHVGAESRQTTQVLAGRGRKQKREVGATTECTECRQTADRSGPGRAGTRAGPEVAGAPGGAEPEPSSRLCQGAGHRCRNSTL
ncbi:gametogenetin-like [Lepus europaeus]|uniref:gametogenetin-like n=1 Tax=Lepus europaeus TaxID=9983 RepID=UPI002B490C6D|nr:gametogenetin-like [Lepus europaeus]